MSPVTTDSTGFASALRRAIDVSGYTLAQLRRVLAERGVTVTVTVALDLAGTVTDSEEKVRSMPCPAQLVECSVKSSPSTISDSAWPPSV